MSPSAISTVSGGSENAGTASAIARQDVVRQREQRVALGARRKGVERLLGALGELGGAAVRVVDRPVLAEDSQQVVPLIRSDRAIADDVAHDPAAIVSVLAEEVDERQRHLPLAQIA